MDDETLALLAPFVSIDTMGADRYLVAFGMVQYLQPDEDAELERAKLLRKIANAFLDVEQRRWRSTADPTNRPNDREFVLIHSDDRVQPAYYRASRAKTRTWMLDGGTIEETAPYFDPPPPAWRRMPPGPK